MPEREFKCDKMKMNKKVMIGFALIAAFMMLVVPLAIVAQSDMSAATNPEKGAGVSTLTSDIGPISFSGKQYAYTDNPTKFATNESLGNNFTVQVSLSGGIYTYTVTGTFGVYANLAANSDAKAVWDSWTTQSFTHSFVFFASGDHMIRTTTDVKPTTDDQLTDGWYLFGNDALNEKTYYIWAGSAGSYAKKAVITITAANTVAASFSEGSVAYKLGTGMTEENCVSAGLVVKRTIGESSNYYSNLSGSTADLTTLEQNYETATDAAHVIKYQLLDNLNDPGSFKLKSNATYYWSLELNLGGKTITFQKAEAGSSHHAKSFYVDDNQIWKIYNGTMKCEANLSGTTGNDQYAGGFIQSYGQLTLGGNGGALTIDASGMTVPSANYYAFGILTAAGVTTINSNVTITSPANASNFITVAANYGSGGDTKQASVNNGTSTTGSGTMGSKVIIDGATIGGKIATTIYTKTPSQYGAASRTIGTELEIKDAKNISATAINGLKIARAATSSYNEPLVGGVLTKIVLKTGTINVGIPAIANIGEYEFNKYAIDNSGVVNISVNSHNEMQYAVGSVNTMTGNGTVNIAVVDNYVTTGLESVPEVGDGVYALYKFTKSTGTINISGANADTIIKLTLTNPTTYDNKSQLFLFNASSDSAKYNLSKLTVDANNIVLHPISVLGESSVTIDGVTAINGRGAGISVTGNGYAKITNVTTHDNTWVGVRVGVQLSATEKATLVVGSGNEINDYPKIWNENAVIGEEQGSVVTFTGTAWKEVEMQVIEPAPLAGLKYVIYFPTATFESGNDIEIPAHVAGIVTAVNFTLSSDDWTIPTGTVSINAGAKLIVPQKLTVAQGATLTVANGGFLVSKGSVVDNGVITVTTVGSAGTEVGGHFIVSDSGNLTIGTAKWIGEGGTVVLSKGASADIITNIAGGFTATLDGIATIPTGKTFALATNDMLVANGQVNVNGTFTIAKKEAASTLADGKYVASSSATITIAGTKWIASDGIVQLSNAATATLSTNATNGFDSIIEGDATINGNFALTTEAKDTLTVASGSTLTIAQDKTLEVRTGASLVNNGTITVSGILMDSFAADATAKQIDNKGQINVLSGGQLKVGYQPAAAGINIDGKINITAGGKFVNMVSAGENTVVGTSADSPMVTLSTGSIDIDAKSVGGAVAYTLNANSTATAGTFLLKSGDTVTIDGTLTTNAFTIPAGVTVTVNGKITVPQADTLTLNGAITLGEAAVLDGKGTVDFSAAASNSIVINAAQGATITVTLDGSTVSGEKKSYSAIIVENIVAGAEGLTVTKGSVVIKGYYTTDDTGKITIPAKDPENNPNVVYISGSVDSGVVIDVAAEATLEVATGSSLTFEADSALVGKVTIADGSGAEIVYEEGSVVNGAVIEVTTREKEGGVIQVAIIVTLRTENGDKLMLYYEGEYCEVIFIEAFEGDYFVDVLADVGVEPVKSRVSFDGWYNVLNEKVTSGMKVGSAAPTLTAKFTETPREGVTPHTPSIEPTVITVDETGGYDNTSMLIVAVAMLVVAIFVLGFVVLKKRN